MKTVLSRVTFPEIYINPIALRTAKTPKSFGHFEYNRVNKKSAV